MEAEGSGGPGPEAQWSSLSASASSTRPFEAFGLLLTCRALKDFGFAPRDGEVPRRGRSPLRLRDDNGRILELEWQQGGRLGATRAWKQHLAPLRLPTGLFRDSRQPLSHCAPYRPGPPPGSGRCAFHPEAMRRASSKPDVSSPPRGEQLVLRYLGQGKDERISPAHLAGWTGSSDGTSWPVPAWESRPGGFSCLGLPRLPQTARTRDKATGAGADSGASRCAGMSRRAVARKGEGPESSRV
mgnify:CR=1 FL=1